MTAPEPTTRLMASDHDIVVRINVTSPSGLVLTWPTSATNRTAKWPEEIHATWRYHLMSDSWVLRLVHVYGWPTTSAYRRKQSRMPFRVPLEALDRMPSWVRNAIRRFQPRGTPVLSHPAPAS